MVAANWAAPPSGRSSRATAVSTAKRRPISATAAATRSGSSAAGGASGLRVSTRQKPQARVQRSPLSMKVAVPSDQHSEMFGTARLLAHGDQVEAAHALAQGPVVLAQPHRGPEPLRLALGDGEAADLHRHVGGQGLHVGPLPAGRAPALGGAGGHGVDDLVHRDVEAFGPQRGHALVDDAAGHDAVEPGQVGVHVEGEAVHRPPPAELHPDGGDLSGPGRARGDPHPGQAVDPAHVGQSPRSASTSMSSCSTDRT